MCWAMTAMNYHAAANSKAVLASTHASDTWEGARRAREKRDEAWHIAYEMRKRLARGKD